MLETAGNLGAHAAWLATQWPAYRKFVAALRDPATTQRNLLRRLLSSNQDCAYARTYAFRHVRSVLEFQSAVPIVSYDELVPWIERIKNGEPNVLTREPVLMLEKTSGSSAAAKYIAYTRSLCAEFQNALAAWVCDLFCDEPSLLCGRSYWVVTSLARRSEVTLGGLKVGFEGDSQYFGKFGQVLLRRLLAVPNQVARIEDVETSLYVTLRFLLQARSLTFISVWSPSFLLILLEKLRSFGDRLVNDLERGTLTPLRLVPPDLARSLGGALRSDSSQASALAAILNERQIDATRLWPRLRALSCWTSSAARPLIPKVQELFPGVTIQGKGLLATEGVVSIPQHAYGGCIPACTSHFLEFLEPDSRSPRLLHELERDREYSVVLTTGGGLWRYRLGDRVRVKEVKGEIPVLEFIGKADGVSDICGEKLSPSFVGQVLEGLRCDGLLSGSFSMLAPAEKFHGYIFFTDGRLHKPELLDERLRENPQYAYCRDLGQLAPPAVFCIRRGACEAYLRHCVQRGQRAGSVKLTPLDLRGGWEDIFEGGFAAAAVGVMA